MAEISQAERNRQLLDVSAEVYIAMQRIYKHALGSHDIDDKHAVDALFTYVAQLKSENESLHGEVDELRWSAGIEDAS